MITPFFLVWSTIFVRYQAMFVASSIFVTEILLHAAEIFSQGEKAAATPFLIPDTTIMHIMAQ